MVKPQLTYLHSNQRGVFLLMLAMHLAGIIGLSIPESRSFFQALTPFNLLVSAGIVSYFQTPKTKSFFLFVLVAALTGFGIEVLGVKTGMIFGSYKYGATLGFQVFEVPLLIGVNWALLIYTSGNFANVLSKNIWVKCLIGAAIMTALDVLIEPIAIQFDFWHWAQMPVPLKNYLAWFFVSFALHFLFHKCRFEKNNLLAIRLLYLQVLFFAILNLI